MTLGPEISLHLANLAGALQLVAKIRDGLLSEVSVQEAMAREQGQRWVPTEKLVKAARDLTDATTKLSAEVRAIEAAAQKGMGDVPLEQIETRLTAKILGGMTAEQLRDLADEKEREGSGLVVYRGGAH